MTDTIATPVGAAAPTSESRHRADVARLTLQLRQALAEAEAAEGQIALAQQTACSELRRRLDELQEQRRAVLDAEVARREAAGTAAIAAAQRQVDDMLAAGSQVTVANPFAPPIAAGLVVLQPSPGAPLQPSAVVIDIDTLARVCAMVVTEVLEHGFQSWSTVRRARLDDLRPERAHAPRWFLHQMLADGSSAGQQIAGDTFLVHDRGVIGALGAKNQFTRFYIDGNDLVAEWLLDEVRLGDARSITLEAVWYAQGEPGALYGLYADLAGGEMHARDPRPLRSA